MGDTGDWKVVKNWIKMESRETLICVAVSAAALILSIAHIRTFLPFDPAWIAVVLCGVPILAGAGEGLFVRHDIKADVLVSIALVAALVTGQYFAAGEVALIMQIGSLLEDFTADRARKGLEKLIGMTPGLAHLQKGKGEWDDLPLDQIHPGDRIYILPGEMVPLDGEILEGSAVLDQSMMTGESLPLDKSVGDSVFSGCISRSRSFLMEVRKGNEDSSMQRLIRLTREAEEKKAPVVTLADRWASWLVLFALLCALAAWALTGVFLRAVTVLVVFCPCAFILATPTAVLAGIANGAGKGILIRSGASLQKLSGIRCVAFDKTGTLTGGEPEVGRVVCLDPSFSEEKILHLAARLERYSDHPLARAIVKVADLSGVDECSVQVFPGEGIAGQTDGRELLVGKAAFLENRGVHFSSNDLPEERGTVVCVAFDRKLIGVICLCDRIRPEASTVIRELKEMEIPALLLSGDNAGTVRTIADEAGIDSWKAGLMPEDKNRVIQERQEAGEKVCMVGDGINDALALAGADAGIAMGGIGSDVAVETADAVLVEDDISKIPYLFRLTRKVMSKIKMNLSAAMVINITAVVLSIAGILNPVTGALWHNCGSVFVIVNAATLLAYRDQKGKNQGPV